MTIRVHLYKNRDYWKAQWTQDGQRRSVSLGRSTRREALEACRRLEHDLNSQAGSEGSPRLSAWCRQHGELRGDLSARTMDHFYRAIIRSLTEHFYDDPPIGTITVTQMLGWHNTVRKRGLSEASLAKYARGAHAIFHLAVRMEVIDRNPCRELRRTVKVDRNWAEITHAQTERIIAACPDEGWGRLVGLCRYAGLRIHEAQGLTWDCVDLEKNRMVIHPETVRTTKARRRECVIEPARCRTGLLDRMRAWRADAPPGAGRVIERGFANPQRDIRVYLKRAGVPDYARPFHTLRKCRQDELVVHYPEHVVAEWMGNSVAVARGHYMRIREEMYAPPA